MWVLYGLLPTVIVLAIIAGGVALLFRRGADGWNVRFSGVLLGYVSIAMLVGVFLIASGGGALLKAGFAQIGNRDFSYNNRTYSDYSGAGPDGQGRSPRTVDPSDDEIRNDVATGISLTFVGVVLFAVHALGAVLLRRRKAQGEHLISRAYNLLGLAVATLGFLGTGAQALNDVVRRYVVGGDPVNAYQIRHPGEPLATAVLLLPLMLWFGWRVWQEGLGEAAGVDGGM